MPAKTPIKPPTKKTKPASDGRDHAIDLTKREVINLAITRTATPSGTFARASVVFGVSRSTLYRWLRDELMPRDAALLASRDSGIAVELLNPDIDMKELRELVAAQG